MFLKTVLVLLCLVLMAYLAKHLFHLNSRLREEALADKRRQAVDWNAPRRRTKQRSRLSKMLDI